jgi:predicted nuclease of restriction endonuclease-like (RecB) superfamily
MYRLHLQGRKILERETSKSRWLASILSDQLKTPSYIRTVGSRESGPHVKSIEEIRQDKTYKNTQVTIQEHSVIVNIKTSW